MNSHPNTPARAKVAAKISVLLPFPTHALCAQHLLIGPLGYAAEEGLQVTVDSTESPIDAVASVAEGHHDIAEVNTVFAFLTREKEMNIKAFYAVCRAAYRCFAVPVASPITSIAELKGTKIGTDHPDLLHLAGPVLREEGIDPTSDLTWVTDYLRDVVPTEEDLRRLRDGELDAIWTLADSFEMLQADGIQLRRLPSAALTALTPSAALYASHKALEGENRVHIAAYARCVARATAFCEADPESAVRMVWEHYPAARPAPGTEEQSFKRDVAAVRARTDVGSLIHGDKPEWGAATEREIYAWENFLMRHGTVTERRAASEYFDHSLAVEMDYSNVDSVVAR
jgi:NitT/TauT family transport system substrate-binding protein